MLSLRKEMRYVVRVLLAGVLSAAFGLYGQDAPGNDAQSDAHRSAPQGLPPRAAPSEYQAHAKAGSVTVAAEFTGHFVVLPDGTLTTDDYVVVEAGLFAENGAKLNLSPDNFSLRINGKKMPLPSQPYGLVVGNLKDPNYEPPATTSSKTKTTFGGKQEEQSDPSQPPPPVKIPFEVKRAMSQRVQKASLAEGERPLPQAGLLFFNYHGKTSGIDSIELTYKGPAGQATLELKP